jgi:hypothetical protein
MTEGGLYRRTGNLRVVQLLLGHTNTRDPIPRIRMLDGFNEGWIEFEHGEIGTVKGSTDLETVLRGLVEAAPSCGPLRVKTGNARSEDIESALTRKQTSPGVAGRSAQGQDPTSAR